MFSTVQATEVTIGELNDATANSYLPFNGSWKYGYSQQIYTASEVGMAGTISSLTMWLYNSGSSTLPDYPVTIYMAEVSKESFESTTDWVALTSSNLVYTGTLTVTNTAAAAFTFTLDAPFAYSGTGNLLIAINNTLGSYTGGIRGMAVDGESNGSVYGYNDSNGAYDPTNLSSAGFSSTLGSVTTSRLVIELDITPSGPVQICDKPTSLEVSGVTAHEATLTWAGGGDGGAAIYNVEYKKASSDKWTTALEATSLATLTLQNLDPNTAYNVRVNCVCGTDNFSGYKTVNFTTAIALPYGENFDDKTAVPSEWKQYTGLLSDVLAGTASLTTATYGWSFSNTETGVFESKHVYTNIYGTSRKNWLVLPAVPIDNNVQLTFTMALSKSTTTYTAIATTGVDDKFAVLASVNDGATWSLLRQWDNEAGSAYVYNNIALYGEEVTIDLSGYAGQSVKIAFYGESTVSNADNYLHIDDVLIGYVPSCLKPTDLHEVAGRTTKNSTQVGWTDNSTVSNWRIQYKKKAAKEWQTITNVTENPYTLTGLQADTVYSIRVAALCDPTDTTTLTDYTKPISVKTAAGVPYAEPFSTSSLPADWKRYKGNWELVQSGAELESETSGWGMIGKTAALGNGVYPDSTYHLKLNVTGTNCNHWIVSPAISMEAGYQLSFYLALTRSDKTAPTAVTPGEQNDDKFIVGISQNGGETWSVLREWNNSNSQFDAINSTANGQLIKIGLDAYAGKNVMFAFYGESSEGSSSNNLHISGLKIATIPACENSTALDVTGVTGSTATLQWDNVDGAVWQYFYRAKESGEFVPTDAMFTNTTGERSITLTGLLEMTTYSFYLRKQCGDIYSEILSRDFTTEQAIVTVGTNPFTDDFEASSKWASDGCASNGNAWAWGTAVAKDGSHSIYVSQDGGTTNTYNKSTASIIYATKRFYFEETAVYDFSYDWLAKGEGTTYDFVRVALVSDNTELKAGTAIPSGFSNTALPEGWTALDGGSALNGVETWQHKTAQVALNTGYYKVVLIWKQDVSGGTDPAGAIDNFSISKMACAAPSGLSVSSLEADGAVVSWDDFNDGSTWVYALALDTAAAPEASAYTPIAASAIQLDSLTECTAYKFYLKKVCGEGFSEVSTISFQTPQTPVAVGKRFVDDFEGNSKWLFLNGELENAWVIDTAAHNGGSKALYISNDGGLTHAYTNNKAVAVFATKMFSFLDDKYIFSYDWLANGETTYDYIRVALVPASVELTAGTSLPSGLTYQALPAGWIALDGGGKLNLKTEWQNFVSNEINITAGDYKVVILWRDDTSGGTNPPAAIDNFTITRVLCAMPENVRAESISTDSALIAWHPNGQENAWLLRYKEEKAADWTSLEAPLEDTLCWLKGLTPATIYNVQVASWCDTTDVETISEFTNAVQFVTECVPFASLSEDFDSLAATTSAPRLLPICWSAINTCSYSSYNYYPTAYKGATAAYSGDNYLRFYSYYPSSASSVVTYDPQDQYAILPELENVAGMRLKLYARANSTGAYYDATFTVGVMSNPADTATFEPIATQTPTSTEYQQFVIPFDSYAGNGKYIAIKMEAAAPNQPSHTYGYRSVYLDDIVVEAIPNCLEPTGLQVIADSLTTNSAVFAWASQGVENAWLVQYKKSVDTVWIDAPLANDTIYHLAGLESATRYDVRVAAKCGEADASPYTSAVSFVTVCEPWSIALKGDYQEGFESYDGVAYNVEGVTPNCWETGGTSTYAAPHVVASGTYAYVHEGENSLNFCASANSFCYAVLPEFVEPLSGLQISFWTRMESATAGQLSLGYIKQSADTIFTLKTYTNTQTMTQYEEVLDTIPAAAYRLVFLWNHPSTSYYSCCIDDIEVSAIPTCLKPQDLAVDSIAKHSAVLTWSPQSDESAWLVQYKKSADTIWTAAPLANDTIYQLAGLDAATAYDVKVAAKCSETDMSKFTEPISFITDCEALSEFPYTEGFDSIEGVTSGHVMPLCWKYINTCTYSTYNYYPTVYKSATYAASGTNSLKFYSYYSSSATYTPEDQYAILPEMDSVNINELCIKFKARKYSASYAADFYVGVMSDPSDTSTFVAIKHIEPTSATYAPFEVRLNRYRGNGKYIAIKMDKAAPTGSATYAYRGVHIDDIVVEMLPSCLEVEELKVSDRTASSAVISWLNGSDDQNAWQIAYSANPAFNIAEVVAEDIMDITSNPYTLSNLLPDTLYNVYVRANCGGADSVSAWMSTSFKTVKTCQTPDELKVDSITVSSALIGWATYGQTGFNLRYSADAVNWDTVYNVLMPYLLDSLQSKTTYRVQVQVACAEADDWSTSISFKTAYGIPFEEQFSATSKPADWNLYSGKLNADGTATLTTSSVWNFGSNNGVLGSHARSNIYGTTCNKWMATPNVFVAGNVQLTFDLALTKYSGSDSPVPGGQPDDKFDVLISTDNGSHWTILREWSNAAGAEYVYDNITNAADGEPVAISLAEYSGKQIIIAFYGESTESNGDNNIHVDNVTIDLVPTCLKPKKLSVSNVKAHTAKLSWTNGDEDQSAWQIAVDTLATFNPDSVTLIDVTTNPYVLDNLDPSTTYYVYVRANCGDEDGVSKWSDKQSFTTTVACPAPANLKAKLTPGNGAIATLFWEAEAESYLVQYSLNSDFSDSLEVVVTDTVAYLTGLTADTTYYARVKADCGAIDSLSVWSSVISFFPSDIYSITINDGTKTNEYVPVYGYYADQISLSQFIIPAEQLEEIIWDSIQQLTFYASQTSVDWGAAKFEVYMAETDETSISALGDWTKMTQVMSAGSLSISDHKMVVNLSVPYWYQGDNLIIGFKQTVKGDDGRSYWYGQTAEGASYAGYQSTGSPIVSQRNFLPKTTVLFAPGQAPACIKPRHVVVSNVSDYKATVKWDAVEDAIWQYALIASDTLPAEADFVNITGDSIAFTDLVDGTDYVFYLRKFCGEDGTSDIVAKAFATPLHVEAIPFEEDFEGKNVWKLINGTSENAWVVGTAANEGKALYISNNGGASNTYTFTAQTAVYATLLLDIEEAGDYNFTYDWKANGEYSAEDNEAYDYLRIALAPATTELEAGLTPYLGLADTLLPAGWVALDGGKALVQSTQWKHERYAHELTAGQYKVVIAWINDNESGNNTPAAIDNFSVKARHCNQPTELTASNIMPTSATLSWNDGEDVQRAWQIAYSTSEELVPDSVNAIDVASNPYVMAGLQEATTYYVSVRVNCGEGDYSNWSLIHSFTTMPHCEVMASEVLDTICAGSSYTWNGKVYTEEGTYKDTLFHASAQGCDSIVTLVLSYYGAEDTIRVADTIRQDELPYRYKAAYVDGQPQIAYAVGTALGVYVDTALVQGEHCAAVLIHTLTIEHAICETTYAQPETASFCAGDTYTWRGKHYSVPATYYDTTQNMFGCDSVFTLTLSYYAPEDTLYAADTINETELPYRYTGHQYAAGQAPIIYEVGTKPGKYIDTVLVQGAHCAAALIHTLTIEPKPCETVYAETLNDTICLGETYTWNGKEYTAAGLYYDTLATLAGCDSIASLQLSFYEAEDTIRVADSISQDDLPYTYEAPYIADQLPIHYDLGTEAGVYVDTALVQGDHCPAVLILTLTINKSQAIDNIYGRDGKRVQKLIYNDAMYIIVDDEWYNAAGQKVSNPRN